MIVWLNGAWVDREQARVSAFDAGFQHGVGVFETLLARNGRVFRLGDHLERLARSARELGLVEHLRIDPLGDAVEATVERNQLRDARVRLTVTGGDLNLLQREGDRRSHDPTILIVAQPPTRYPSELFARGVVVAIADGRLNPLDRFAGHKTLWYWPRLAALQAAGAGGASEALWFSVTNHLACGCVSNAFLVKDGRLLTPWARGEELPAALPAPVPPGITRAAIIDLAESMGLPVERRQISIDELLGADEVFLTNSSWGVLPVRAVERTPIGSPAGDAASDEDRGGPGPWTTRLRDAWLAVVAGETTGSG